MDVHAPHHPVNNWREFVTHLVIVTIGLFIALMMEAGVEWLHHRHIVREARENIRRELQDNHNAAQRDLAQLDKNIALEQQNIAAIHALQDHPENFHGSVTNHFDFDSPDDAAWRTARDTGALGYMPYDEVQRYSDVYTLGDFMNSHAMATAEKDFLSAAPFEMGFDPGKLPPEEYTELLRENAAVEIQLKTLKQLVQQFDDLCVAELKR